jgi:hypothetical protein
MKYRVCCVINNGRGYLYSCKCVWEMKRVGGVDWIRVHVYMTYRVCCVKNGRGCLYSCKCVRGMKRVRGDDCTSSPCLHEI